MEPPPERLLRRFDYDALAPPDPRVRRAGPKTLKVLNCEVNRKERYCKSESNSAVEYDSFTEEFGDFSGNIIHMKLLNRSGGVNVGETRRDGQHPSDSPGTGHTQATKGMEAYAGASDTGQYSTVEARPRAARCDKATLIVTRSPSETYETSSGSSNLLSTMCKRIEELEQKVLTQELCFERFRSSCAEAASREFHNSTSATRASVAQREPCCSYVDQYSHIPEVSAFNRGLEESDLIAKTVDDQFDDEPHTSAHYSCDRDLNRVATAYDGLVKMRSRRQTASMPLNQSTRSRQSHQASGASTYRSKSRPNHLKDYKLMDTVHYLAQGEFAPRNDGIKLTASREAVLSDIIWEDVCRTHWPQVNLTRRNRAERKLTHRSDLQRHIDSLLRDRLHHVERKKRKNYKAVMKVDHNNEQMKLGKGRALIVATHRGGSDQPPRKRAEVVRVSPSSSGEQFAVDSEHEPCASDDEYMERRPDLAGPPDMHYDEPAPGPSGARHRTSCARSSSPTSDERRAEDEANLLIAKRSRHSVSDAQSDSRPVLLKVPHFVIKRRESFNKKKQTRREKQSKCRHYVFLPTIVVKAPLHRDGASGGLRGVCDNTSQKIKPKSKISSQCQLDAALEDTVPGRDKDALADDRAATGHHHRN